MHSRLSTSDAIWYTNWPNLHAGQWFRDLTQTAIRLHAVLPVAKLDVIEQTLIDNATRTHEYAHLTHITGRGEGHLHTFQALFGILVVIS